MFNRQLGFGNWSLLYKARLDEICQRKGKDSIGCLTLSSSTEFPLPTLSTFLIRISKACLLSEVLYKKPIMRQILETLGDWETWCLFQWLLLVFLQYCFKIVKPMTAGNLLTLYFDKTPLYTILIETQYQYS